jgi:hypothetical protein
MQAESEQADPFETIAGDISRVSFRYGIPESQVRSLLNDPSTTSSECMAGRGGQSAPAERLERLIKTIERTGAEYWTFRVRNSAGAEALFDREMRFLAVSKRGRTLRSAGGSDVELPERVFVGTRYLDLLPTRDSLLGDAHPGLDGLIGMGFFDGAMSGVQLRLEMNFGFHAIFCDMEIWAVRTLDRGILGHSQIHQLDANKFSVEAPGVKVHSVVYC